MADTDDVSVDARNQHLSFDEHLDFFQKSNRLELRNDHLSTDEFMYAIDDACPFLDEFGWCEVCDFCKFKFTRDEMFPESAHGELARHAEALRAAGFDENSREEWGAGLTQAECEFATFLAETMKRTGALDRFKTALDELSDLHATWANAQRLNNLVNKQTVAAAAAFRDRYGTAFHFFA